MVNIVPNAYEIVGAKFGIMGGALQSPINRAWYDITTVEYPEGIFVGIANQDGLRGTMFELTEAYVATLEGQPGSSNMTYFVPVDLRDTQSETAFATAFLTPGISGMHPNILGVASGTQKVPMVLSDVTVSGPLNNNFEASISARNPSGNHFSFEIDFNTAFYDFLEYEEGIRVVGTNSLQNQPFHRTHRMALTDDQLLMNIEGRDIPSNGNVTSCFKFPDDWRVHDARMIGQPQLGGDGTKTRTAIWASIDGEPTYLYGDLVARELTNTDPTPWSLSLTGYQLPVTPKSHERLRTKCHASSSTSVTIGGKLVISADGAGKPYHALVATDSYSVMFHGTGSDNTTTTATVVLASVSEQLVRLSMNQDGEFSEDCEGALKLMELTWTGQHYIPGTLCPVPYQRTDNYSVLSMENYFDSEDASPKIQEDACGVDTSPDQFEQQTKLKASDNSRSVRRTLIIPRDGVGGSLTGNNSTPEIQPEPATDPLANPTFN